MREREQKLIDIMFEIAIRSADMFRGKSREQIAEIVAMNLRHAGWDTCPMGMSWGVLVDDGVAKVVGDGT